MQLAKYLNGNGRNKTIKKMHEFKIKSVIKSILFFLCLLLVGVIGYVNIEDFSLIEAVYMTINAMSTVGFGEVHELSQGGRIFTSILILASFGIFGYVLTTITQYAVDGNFSKYFKNYRVNQKIVKLKDHVIICGYGRNGRQVADELEIAGKSFVIIDKNERIVDELRNREIPCINGDATIDETLLTAGIHKATSLITAFPSDADNLFVVVTAKELKPNLNIVSRASYSHSIHKLKSAGASNVIMPGRIGGSRMAKLVTQPDVVEFLESIMVYKEHKVNIHEIPCQKEDGCAIDRKTIGELHIRKRTGANIVGIKDLEGKFSFNPPDDTPLSCSDKLFILGTVENVDNLKKLLREEL